MKTCPECNEPVHGRKDKKFCSDLCRNNHNNEKKESSSEMTAITYILRRNRKILAQMISKPKKKLSKDKLLQQGFNFYYFTSIDNSRGGNCYFCFEYGYLPLENGIVKLMKQSI